MFINYKIQLEGGVSLCIMLRILSHRGITEREERN